MKYDIPLTLNHLPFSLPGIYTPNYTPLPGAAERRWGLGYVSLYIQEENGVPQTTGEARADAQGTGDARG
jgi:hypothetical protein